MSTLYPVCVAHVNDRMPADRLVAVSGALILISGLGSVAGPLIGTPMMERFGIDGVLYLIARTALLLAGVTVVRSYQRAAAVTQERTFEILAPHAAALGHNPCAGDAAAESPPSAGTADGGSDAASVASVRDLPAGRDA